ncbi:redoxin family protein [Rhizorhapis suberifaciens]|uniref:Cytochrome c biogenesis protein CcmG/thiol:disulfide interchange protein DsbE n=1 Tax=Rhizorhapis suberifaciens TaxID=13656 RepID=A0A840HXM3_9SPHN|nr:redoxin family protein [Rhizorhapis suberifaciens]MBB4642310.1 cytochrome c biogenesis protein CcmG/thiol:disulfide interchange protein DsbE [Rhizorhapis suberifaciens]
MSRWILWVPLALFAIFFAIFASGIIKPSDRTIQSRMIGKPLPQFALPAGVAERPGLRSADFARGKPRLLNIFASWCVPCAAEAAQLATLKEAGVKIDGVAIRDSREDLSRFLGRWGNPYATIGSDVDSSVQIALGSSGVPETFVINGRGLIAYQHIGEIREEDVPILLQKLREAR